MAEYFKRVAPDVEFSRVGDSYPENTADLQNLRHVLHELGFYRGVEESPLEDPSMYDEALSAAVENLQNATYLASNGRFGPAARDALNRMIDAENINTAAAEKGIALEVKEIAVFQEGRAYTESQVKGIIQELGYRSIKDFAHDNNISLSENESPTNDNFLRGVNRVILEKNHEHLLDAAARSGIRPDALQPQSNPAVSSFLNSTVEIDPQQIADETHRLISALPEKLQQQMYDAHQKIAHQEQLTSREHQRGSEGAERS